jgi:hypothetical protein
MQNRIFIIMLLSIVVVSCTLGLEKYGTTFSSVMKNGNGVFRGLKPGDSRDFVRRSEAFDPIAINDQMISYEIPLADDGHMVVTYGFEKDTLYEITMDLYVENTETALQIIKNFKAYYDDKFGIHNVESGFCVWKTEDEKRKSIITIEMTNEYEFETIGNWSFSVYDYSIALTKNNSTIIKK